MRSIVISLFLYACGSLTLTSELEKRTHAFEMRCYRRLLNISYNDHNINEEIRRKIQVTIGDYDELLTLVNKRQKLGTVTSFKNFGAVLADIGPKWEILSRIVQATAVVTKLKNNLER